jgi:hypothetical protein
MEPLKGPMPSYMSTSDMPETQSAEQFGAGKMGKVLDMCYICRDELSYKKPESAQNFGKEFIVRPLRAARAAPGAPSGPEVCSGLLSAPKNSQKECFHLHSVNLELSFLM